MKKVLFLILVSFSLYSCNRGMNQSIMEPLDVKVLKSQIKNDSTFTALYKNTQELRAWILKSDIRQAKYGEITYKRIKKYQSKMQDTTFTNKILDAQREEYELLYGDYTSEVDSVMRYWYEYSKEYSLDSLVKIEFNDLWKEYYSYSGDVKDVNIGFSITPLKGTIQQLIFRYCIKSKISSDGKMNYYDSHRCLASSPISSKRTLYWEADYSDEKYLKNMSASTVKRDYDFIIEVVEVRKAGENMSEKLELIPKYVQYALDDNDFDGGIWKDDIIKEDINPEYVSFWTYAKPKFDEQIKKVDPLVYELYDEKLNDDDDE